MRLTILRNIQRDEGIFSIEEMDYDNSYFVWEPLGNLRFMCISRYTLPYLILLNST